MELIYVNIMKMLKNNDKVLYDKLEETYKLIADEMGEL